MLTGYLALCLLSSYICSSMRRLYFILSNHSPALLVRFYFLVFIVEFVRTSYKIYSFIWTTIVSSCLVLLGRARAYISRECLKRASTSTYSLRFLVDKTTLTLAVRNYSKNYETHVSKRPQR